MTISTRRVTPRDAADRLSLADITIVIPFWDLRPSILQECIDSLRQQSSDCKLLVVDNASKTKVAPTGNVEVLRLDQRVSIGIARNEGMKVVETPFLMFMDADDVLLPGALHELRSLLVANPQSSIVAGQIVDWDPVRGIRQPKPWPAKFEQWLTKLPSVFPYANSVRNMTPVTGCALMRTQSAQSTSGFPDHATAEDWTFGAMMNFRGSLVLTDFAVKLYRLRDDSLSVRALGDVPALIEARRQTRMHLFRDRSVPFVFKIFWPILFVLQLLELPFHMQREHAFARDVRSTTPSRVPATLSEGVAALVSASSQTSVKSRSLEPAMAGSSLGASSALRSRESFRASGGR